MSTRSILTSSPCAMRIRPWHRMVRDGPADRPDHPGRLRLLRGSRHDRRTRAGRWPSRTTRAATWPRPSRASRRRCTRTTGCLTASRHSIESAAFWFMALERCCQQQLDIAAVRDRADPHPGRPRPLQPRARGQRLYRLAAFPDHPEPAGRGSARHVRLIRSLCLLRSSSRRGRAVMSQALWCSQMIWINTLPIGAR